MLCIAASRTNGNHQADAMVDRAMRRLAQMKFMKQISASSERQLKDLPTLQIEAPKNPRRQKDKK
jgi:uncharacterized protein YlbG (UPF0298 family)